MTILVTGGTGYIGSHTVVQLLAAGHDVLILDNFCNSKSKVVDRIAKIAGKTPGFIEGDIRDRALLKSLFAEHAIETVIHFAGLKAVGESVQKPLMYYDNNVSGSIVLFEEMAAASVKEIVFSSSATVYGDPQFLPITEDHPLSVTNPYGQNKLMIENILRDIYVADPSWKIALLRYFNPVGAHISGTIGEDPADIPNNLMPFVAQVAVGKRKLLQVFGNDYDTVDGTGVRDFIHVEDLASGHLAALDYLQKNSGVLTVNLGTGTGTSVIEMIEAFKKASGKTIAYEVVARRSGDIASCYADPTKAKAVLGWQARYGIDRMCEDAWRWQSQNPNGFN
ncbi:UDP-glucose 4-epimerase GalE [Polynucleobacter paneuropaeus]|nr:UDP-glucose 4-epimerase GalE [Polynucleobacter paneuropaeus]MBT8530987.1 UDP-glucose 4-epimerase GalE [Polynucleobacter paneuropaeus]MBT8602456.1 UDP-glucose 4-epimerase GalE [Polynucleobacter paneuropaeus]MBT8624409.1 UDP-glucose 4-epimerase GalE [Polynucleobacter paneuropaeus]MBT8628706.1 UDP-glucose 4-epimerase GalE [Polynucleobacter paneuropaeus]